MKQYIADAFTREPFSGNPAAVCVMEKWPSEEAMMKLAMENNLSETAFIVKEPEGYHLRWFTPGTEVELCGHATLASSFVILNYYEPESDEVVFNTMSGPLTVKRKGNLYEMDFPTYELREIPVTDEMERAFGARPIKAVLGLDLVCVFDSEETVREMKPDLIVVAAFGHIIPKEILDLPEYGCINVHASLLPAYRGAAPIQHAILDGLDETGVTIMLMNEGLDTGDILASRTVPITPDTTGGSLFDQLAKEGASLLAETIPGIVSGSIHPTPQPEKSTTPYASMISKNMGRIDWTKDAVYIERLVRAMDPWPSAWTYLDGKILKIWKAHVEKTDLQGDEAHTGKVVRQDARGFYIQTGMGILVPEEVQIEGRKRMTAAEFLRGFIIRDNDLTKDPENSRV